MEQALTLSQYNRLIVDAMQAPALRARWVTAETVDVRRSGPHMYLELIEKDPSGATVARLGAAVWGSTLPRLDAIFYAATGARIATGMKVMVCLSATFHPLYGLRAVVTNINPEYTLGDLMRRRREILQRLAAEGVVDMNRSLQEPRPALRVAVVSARGAAGFGDFMHQLAGNGARLAFRVRLFEAIMQGDKAAPSIIAALERVAAEAADFDVVVIIRGGGATSDLATLDDYDLAANVAQFPLPVIVGVGHERDTTVLDAVAWLSVKTPTAAAEWLVGRGKQELDLLRRLASDTVRLSAAHVAGGMRRLDYIAGQLPQIVLGQLQRRRARLDALGEMMQALSPEATLRRGYSVLRVDGHAVTDAALLPPGTRVEATLARGRAVLRSESLSNE